MKRSIKLLSTIFVFTLILTFSTQQNAAAAPIAFDLSAGNEGLWLVHSIF